MKVILVNGSPMKKAAHIRRWQKLRLHWNRRASKQIFSGSVLKLLRAVLPVTAVPKLAAAFFMTRSMNFWSWHLLMTAIFLVRLYIGLQPEER